MVHIYNISLLFLCPPGCSALGLMSQTGFSIFCSLSFPPPLPFQRAVLLAGLSSPLQQWLCKGNSDGLCSIFAILPSESTPHSFHQVLEQSWGARCVAERELSGTKIFPMTHSHLTLWHGLQQKIYGDNSRLSVRSNHLGKRQQWEELKINFLLLFSNSWLRIYWTLFQHLNNGKILGDTLRGNIICGIFKWNCSAQHCEWAFKYNKSRVKFYSSVKMYSSIQKVKENNIFLNNSPLVFSYS